MKEILGRILCAVGAHSWSRWQAVTRKRTANLELWTMGRWCHRCYARQDREPTAEEIWMESRLFAGEN